MAGRSVISGLDYEFVPQRVAGTPPAASLPLLPVRKLPGGGWSRDLSLESKVSMGSGLVEVRDQLAVVRLDLDMEGVDWLLEELDGDNLATVSIAYARELAMRNVWDRIREGDWSVRAA